MDDPTPDHTERPDQPDRPPLHALALPADPDAAPDSLPAHRVDRGFRLQRAPSTLPHVPAAPLTGCPYLALPEDRATHFTFPHAQHLCFATPKPSAIDEPFQATHCLGAAYPDCPRYMAAEHPVPVRTGATDAGRAWPVRQARPRRDLPETLRRQSLLRIGTAVVAGLGAVLALIGLLGLGGIGLVPTPASSSTVGATGLPPSGPRTGPVGGAGPELPDPRPSGASSPAASVVPTPPGAPTGAPPPSPAPSIVAPTPSPAPTLTPTPTPSPSYRSYIVQPGDTVSSIARRFATTVDAIVRLNKLASASFIRAGQRLLIP